MGENTRQVNVEKKGEREMSQEERIRGKEHIKEKEIGGKICLFYIELCQLQTTEINTCKNFK